MSSVVRWLQSLLAGSAARRLTDDRRQVVLRDERSQGDIRRLTASYSAAGDLAIEGYDWGDTVQALLGAREYEWHWTVRAADLPRLRAALQAEGELLNALQQRFQGSEAADLPGFLRQNGIDYRAWSRSGD